MPIEAVFGHSPSRCGGHHSCMTSEWQLTSQELPIHHRKGLCDVDCVFLSGLCEAFPSEVGIGW
jgi:hypothetical protein